MFKAGILHGETAMSVCHKEVTVNNKQFLLSDIIGRVIEQQNIFCIFILVWGSLPPVRQRNNGGVADSSAVSPTADSIFKYFLSENGTKSLFLKVFFFYYAH